MSLAGQYPIRAFSESQTFLVFNPSTQQVERVLGSDLVGYITPNLDSVRGNTTRAAAQNEDYPIGTFVQTAGGSAINDGGNGMFLVVEGGTGDYPMLNGYDLLLLPFGSLAGSNLDGALVTDDGVQVEIEDSIALRPVRYASMEAVRLSTTSHDYIETSAFYAGGTTGGAKLYRDGTGTPTGSGAAVIAAALAAGTFCNAAGVCYKLRTDQEITLYTFGFSAASDETDSVLAAITFTAGVCKLFWPPATCNSDPIVVPSNSHWVFHRECVLKATTGYGSTSELLDFTSADDVTLECNGATFQMLKSEYVTGEHRHCFNLVNCSDVLITDPNAIDSGGDGYYINGATRVTLVNPVADNNRRNGMSIIKANTLRVINPILKNTTGTAPQSGLVIEPNGTTDDLIDIVIDSPQLLNNDGSGLVIYLDDYKTGTPNDVSITINNPVSKSNAEYGYSISNVYLNSGAYAGFINIHNPVSMDEGYNAIRIVDKSKDAPFLKITNPTIINPCETNSAYPYYSGIYIGDTSSAVGGSMHIDNVTIDSDNVGMDYGIYVESGGGFTEDMRITMSGCKGHQVNSVRWGNITSTIADATDAIIDVSKLRGTSAITAASTNITATYAGEIITNAGAGAGTTYLLREYLPPGNKYRFRVEAAQTVTIDVFDATDRIVGTTTAGASVTSNVVGAECEVFYLGTFSTVRYWKLNPIGPAASWTFN